MDAGWFGVALGAIATVVTIFATAWGKTTKAVCFEIVSTAPLGKRVGAEDKLNRLTLLFDGAPVHDPYLVVFRVRNNGGAALREDDFDGPLCFTLGAPVLEAGVHTASPATFVPRVAVTNDEITVEPIQMNARDEVHVHVLTHSAVGELVCRGRITGGEVRAFRSSLSKAGLGVMAALIVYAVCCLSLFVAVAGPAIVSGEWKTVIIVACVLIVVGLVPRIYAWDMLPDRWR